MGSRAGETSSAKVGVGAAGADVEAFGNDTTDVATPMAAPTRRTLTFPTSEVLRRPSARPREDEPRSSSLFTAEAPPTLLLRARGGSESSAELRDDDDRSSPASDVERPSERSTVPTLDSTGVAAADSSASMIELSVSELESVHEVSTVTDEALAAPRVPRLEAGDGKVARAISEWPRPLPPIDPPTVIPRARRARRAAVGLLVSHGLVAVAVALVAGSGGAPSSMTTIVREPNVALSERTPLSRPGGLGLPPPPPSGGCAASGDARVLAPRAQIGPGLDVTVLETGFGVALASGSREAVGIRVEGSGLRIAETVRVKAPTLVSHAVVESGLEEDSDSLDVRVDADDARTITSAGEAPAFRIVARGGSILALVVDDLRGVRARTIWPLPGGGPVARAPALVGSPRPPTAPKSNPYRPPGFSKLSDAPRPPTASPRQVALGPELVRAIGRDDGGAVVALRRPSMLYVGVTDASLAPAGPLLALSRKGATVGTPTVAPWGGGGAIAWAEREAGEREWSIIVAAFAPDGEGATTLGPIRVIGKGMSPTLAALPDGDLLLAHADGPPGAHRVVAVRLGRDLDPRGEALVLSPESINAGQPALAVRPDGRAIVAFFAADRGRSAAVFATPLACDPGF